MLVVLTIVGCEQGKNDSTATTAQQWSSIQGTLEYSVVVGGVDQCDATVEFTGVPYAGFCAGCDFVFEVDAAVTRDGGSGACFYNSTLSLYENSARQGSPTVIAFASSYDYYGYPYYAPYPLEDWFLVGYTYVRESGHEAKPRAYHPGVFLKGYHYAGHYFGGHASLEGDVLTWGLEFGSGTDYYSDLDGFRYDWFPNFCSFDYVSEATGPYDAGHTVYGSLPCTEYAMDTFTFDGEAGGTADVTLDVTGGNPSTDPVMWIYGPDSCVERWADDNFACTASEKFCPALSLPTEAAEYLLVVLNRDPCTDESGTLSDYRLDMASDWDPGLTAVVDDQADGPLPATYRVEARATLTK